MKNLKQNKLFKNLLLYLIRIKSQIKFNLINKIVDLKIQSNLENNKHNLNKMNCTPTLKNCNLVKLMIKKTKYIKRNLMKYQTTKT